MKKQILARAVETRKFAKKTLRISSTKLGLAWVFHRKLFLERKLLPICTLILFAILSSVTTVHAGEAEGVQGVQQGDTGHIRGSANSNMINAAVASGSSFAAAAPLVAKCPTAFVPCSMGLLSLVAGAAQLVTSLRAQSSRNKLGDGIANTPMDTSEWTTSGGLDGDPIADPDGGHQKLANPRRQTPSRYNTLSTVIDELEAEQQHLQQQAAAAGYTYDPTTDTLTTPQGTYAANQINTLDKMQAAGLLSANDRPAAEAALQAAQQKGAARARKILRRLQGAGRAGGRSTIQPFQFNKPKTRLRSSFYFSGKKKLSTPGKALSRNIAGEKVGIFSDGLFFMIHRRYKQKPSPWLKK